MIITEDLCFIWVQNYETKEKLYNVGSSRFYLQYSYGRRKNLIWNADNHPDILTSLLGLNSMDHHRNLSGEPWSKRKCIEISYSTMTILYFPDF